MPEFKPPHSISDTITLEVCGAACAPSIRVLFCLCALRSLALLGICLGSLPLCWVLGTIYPFQDPGQADFLWETCCCSRQGCQPLPTLVFKVMLWFWWLLRLCNNYWFTCLSHLWRAGMYAWGEVSAQQFLTEWTNRTEYRWSKGRVYHSHRIIDIWCVDGNLFNMHYTYIGFPKHNLVFCLTIILNIHTVEQWFSVLGVHQTCLEAGYSTDSCTHPPHTEILIQWAWGSALLTG